MTFCWRTASSRLCSSAPLCGGFLFALFRDLIWTLVASSSFTSVGHHLRTLAIAFACDDWSPHEEFRSVYVGNTTSISSAGSVDWPGSVMSADMVGSHGVVIFEVKADGRCDGEGIGCSEGMLTVSLGSTVSPSSTLVPWSTM